MSPSTAAYDALRDAAGVLAGDDRVLVRVWGDRAREMIGGLVTNHVAALEPGRALYAFMLTPKGRPLAELRVLAPGPGELWLDAPVVCEEGLLEHLGRYLPPIYARFERLGGRRRLSVVGPLWAATLAALGGLPDPGDLEPLEMAASDGRWLVRREPIEGPGADVYVAASEAHELHEALVEAARRTGGGASGPEAYEVWRIERGVPVFGSEIGLDILPQETGQEARAIDYAKGCYTGQEVVARIHFRGHVNRRLAGIRLGGDAAISTGAELLEGPRSRGHVTSAARSPRLGPIGLAYVRRELEAGARLAVGSPEGPAAEVVDLPFEGASSPG